MSTRLSLAERGTLLRLARAAIAERLLRDGRLDRALAQLALTPALERPCGVFVTLKQRDTARSLRGCIGAMHSSTPLYRELLEIAPKAAFDDPRFPPLAVGELDQVDLSVSVLTPLERVGRHTEIEIGRHGVQLVQGHRRAVFLPQVAVEQGWDVERLLHQLSLKAGLDAAAWRSAELYVFGSESFGEGDASASGG